MVKGKMEPQVSVCIPTFNRKDYLRQALDSVAAQTYNDYELIVLDDGSTDGTQEMIRSCGGHVRYYWQANCGEALTRNRLIELARGQFITFLDSDDLLLPDAVERMAKVMEAQSGKVVVYGPYIRIDEDGGVCGRCKRKLYSGHVTKYLFQDVFVHSCGSMFPKTLLEETGGFNGSLPVSGDYDLWLRLSLKCPFVALSEPTFKRRRHRGNLSCTSSSNQIVELNMLERFYNEKGGNTVVPHRIAMRRLSREEYRVGKYFLREGDFGAADRYFAASLRRHPSIRAVVGRCRTILRRLMAR
ncbi:MAG: glycosyltransferase [Planctomycetota bacterium]